MIRIARGVAAVLTLLVVLGWWLAWQANLVHAASPIASPTGPALVGRTDALVTGGGREVMVSAWYPAAESRPPAPYIPASTLVARSQIALQSAQWLHAPFAAAAMATAMVPAGQDAPVDGDGLPVVVMSPGLGTPRWILSGLAADLASRGWVVVVVDHTGESPAVEFPDGRIAYGTAPDAGDPGYMGAELDLRVADVRLVLDRLEALPIVGGHLDLDRIAVVGHSYGGFTAAAVMAVDPRVKAGVVLDGSAGWRGAAPIQAVDRPLLMLANGELVHASWLQLGGPFQLATVRGAGHYTPTDLPSFSADAALCGTIPAGRGTDISRAIVSGFLDQHVRGFASAAETWPEVDWRR